MSGLNHHLHVPDDSAFASPRNRRHRPASPHDEEVGLVDHFIFGQDTNQPTLRDLDRLNGVTRSPSPPQVQVTDSNMSAEERMAHLTQLAEAQQKQLEAANNYSAQQDAQLQESKRQLQEAQDLVRSLHRDLLFALYPFSFRLLAWIAVRLFICLASWSVGATIGAHCPSCTIIADSEGARTVKLVSKVNICQKFL